MISASEQKTYWNLGETLIWIRERDHDRVAGMWEMSEFEAVTRSLLDRRLLPKVMVETSILQIDGDTKAAAASPEASPRRDVAAGSLDLGEGNARTGTPSVPAESVGRQETSAPDRIRKAVMRRVQTRRVRMTMIRADGDGERSPITAEEANDLELRITEDPVAPVVVWSPIQQTVLGTSPWFSRTDVIRAWPESSRKTAAAAGAILQHLREISRPEAPLTKDQARRRCLDGIPNAFPAAFERAWKQLEPTRKRGRGKHD